MIYDSPALNGSKGIISAEVHCCVRRRGRGGLEARVPESFLRGAHSREGTAVVIITSAPVTPDKHRD